MVAIICVPVWAGAEVNHACSAKYASGAGDRALAGNLLHYGGGATLGAPFVAEALTAGRLAWRFRPHIESHLRALRYVRAFKNYGLVAGGVLVVAGSVLRSERNFRSAVAYALNEVEEGVPGVFTRGLGLFLNQAIFSDRTQFSRLGIERSRLSKQLRGELAYALNDQPLTNAQFVSALQAMIAEGSICDQAAIRADEFIRRVVWAHERISANIHF